MPICEQCGIDHSIDQLELSFKRPDIIAELATDERSSRVQENNDLAVLDGERFFVRAVLPLAVLERARPYNLGVWVEVDQRSFERIYALWDEVDQSNEPPFRASLANEVPLLPQTNGLAAELRLVSASTRPSVRLAPTAHPLVVEQFHGITEHRAHEYSSVVS